MVIGNRPLIIYFTYLLKIVIINSLFILIYFLTTTYLITQLYRQYKNWQRTYKFDTQNRIKNPQLFKVN